MKKLATIVGIRIYQIFITALSIMPFLALSLPIWAEALLIILCVFVPPVELIFIIWGLVEIIGGVQDWFAVLYYVLTGIKVIWLITFLIATLADYVINRSYGKK